MPAEDSAPAFRAEAGAEAQRIEAVAPAALVVVEGAVVSPATPGGSGGRNGGLLLSVERERERESSVFLPFVSEARQDFFLSSSPPFNFHPSLSLSSSHVPR